MARNIEMRGVVAVGRYDGLLRDVARGCSEGDVECACQAGRILSAFVPSDAVVIPMPGRDGVARWSRTMAFAAYNCGEDGHVLLDCLKCAVHEPSRHVDGARSPVPVWVSAEFRNAVGMRVLDTKVRFIVVDNVVCTGRMANGAIDALRSCGVPDERICVLALCKSSLSFQPRTAGGTICGSRARGANRCAPSRPAPAKDGSTTPTLASAAKKGKPCPSPSKERAASAPLSERGVCRAASGIGYPINRKEGDIQ